MQIGALLHQLWRHKLGFAVCALFAFSMAIYSTYKPSLAPPGLHPRALEIGAASTEVLVDSPKSKVVDIRAQTIDFQALTTRADLLSNVMASEPVRLFIARHAHIPVQSIAATASLGANLPRAAFEPDSERRASDLLRESDKYRLSLAVNPTLPVIDVNAQAPTAEGAERLANGAVDYLTLTADQQGVADAQRVRLVQLGKARGGVINPGVKLQIALLTFVIVFLAAAGTLRVALKVRHGWGIAAMREKRDGADWWLPRPDAGSSARRRIGPAHDAD
jgi:hypothetical protein